MIKIPLNDSGTRWLYAENSENVFRKSCGYYHTVHRVLWFEGNTAPEKLAYMDRTTVKRIDLSDCDVISGTIIARPGTSETLLDVKIAELQKPRRT